MKKLLCFAALFFVLALSRYSFSGDTQGYILWPDVSRATGSSIYDTLNDSTTKISYAFQAPANGNINTVYLTVKTVTTGGDVIISMQDVDTTTEGFPGDGTADQSVTQSISSAGNLTVSFSTSRSVTMGDWVAVVLEWSGTAGNIDFRSNAAATNGIRIPSCAVYTTAWATNTHKPAIGVGYSDGNIYQINAVNPPGSTGSYTLLTTASTPDEAGSKIEVGFPAVAVGAYIYCRAYTSFDLVVYDSSGTTVRTISLNSNILDDSGAYINGGLFNGELSINTGDVYRIVMKATDSVTGNRMYYLGGINPSLMDAFITDGGVTGTSRTDGGTWTDSTDKLYWAGFILKGMNDATGSGSSSTISYGVFK